MQRFYRLFSSGRFSSGKGRVFWPVLTVFVVGIALGAMLTHFLAPKGFPEKPAPPGLTGEKPVALTSDSENLASPVINVASKTGPAIVGLSSLVTRSDFFASETVEQTGSGVIIDPDGYIVTNNHVVSGTAEVAVTLADGRQTMGKVVGADERTDLAVVKINLPDLTAAAWGDSDEVQVGELAIAIGNPLGMRFARSVTSGVISGVNRLLTTEEGLQFQLLQTDAAINPGNSGGPLLNSRGEIIGINTIKISQPGFEGMGFAVPSNTAKSVAEQLIKNKKVVRPGLGVFVAGDITGMLAVDFDLPVTSGVLIKTVRNGPAQKAGLVDGDIITSVDHKPARNGAELQLLISRHQVGDTVAVTVYRESATGRWEKKTVRVRLAAME